MLREGKEESKRENISREENLGTFVNSAKDFTSLHPKSTLEDFLNHVALITDLDTIDEKKDLVKLMTVHAAKGLEFPVVFVVGMEEELFPHAISLFEDSQLEEERRACYVALTRAKKKLYITAAAKRMTFGKVRQQKISRFVKEIPRGCLEGNLPAPKENSPPPKPKSIYRAPTAYRSAQMKSAEKKSASSVNWQVGDQLNHKKWGLGIVMEVVGNSIVVSFANPEVGIKKLLTTIAPINKI